MTESSATAPSPPVPPPSPQPLSPRERRRLVETSDDLLSAARRYVRFTLAREALAALLGLVAATALFVGVAAALWLVGLRQPVIRTLVGVALLGSLGLWAAWLAQHTLRRMRDPRGLTRAMLGFGPDGTYPPEADALRTALAFAEAPAEATQDDPVLGSPALRLAHIEAASQTLAARELTRRPSPWLTRAFVAAALATGALFALWNWPDPRIQDAVTWALRALVPQPGAKQAVTQSYLADLTVKFQYPTFTGRPERTVRGATGDIAAPAGTIITIEATSLVPVSAAAVRFETASDGVAAPSTGTGTGMVTAQVGLGNGGARRISVAFPMTAAGTYRFVLESDGDELLDRPHALEIETDAAPTVQWAEIVRGDEALAADANGEIEVRGDETLVLRYVAEDDYGLTAVKLATGLTGETKKEITLSNTPEGKERSTVGEHVLELAPFNLRAGDRLSISIIAFDNHTGPVTARALPGAAGGETGVPEQAATSSALSGEAGPQRGTSPVRVLKIFSPAEQRRKLEAKAREVWELAITHLADRLEAERSDKGLAGDVETFSTLNGSLSSLATATGELVRKELAPAMADMGDDDAAATLTTAFQNFFLAVQQEANSEAARLNDAKARVKGDPVAASTSGPLSKSLGDALFARSKKTVGVLEHHILYLEDLLDERRVADLLSQMKELDAARSRLADKIAKLKDKDDPALRAEILREIERIKREMANVLNELAQMQPQIEGFVNPDALAEQAEQMEDLSQMVSENRLDDAMKELDDMAQAMKETVDGLRDRLDAMSEQYQEAASEMDKLAQKLEGLKGEQERLLKQTESIADRARERREADLNKAGRELREKVQARLDQVRKDLREVPDRALPEQVQPMLQAARKRADELDELLKRDDFAEASDIAKQLQGQLDMLPWMLGQKEQGGPREKALQQAGQQSRRINEELQKAMQGAAAQLTGPESKDIQELQRKQGQLAKEVADAGREMGELADKAPALGPGFSQKLTAAEGAMRKAEGHLAQKDPVPATDRQREAIDQLGQASDGLRESAQGMREKEGAGQGGEGMGGRIPRPGGATEMPGGDKDGNGRRPNSQKVAIPKPSEFQVSDEFRKDLLDAMKQGTPETYKEQVKGYYRELIR
jgi:uncharacterized protein YoxC